VRKLQLEDISVSNDYDTYGYGIYGWTYNMYYATGEERVEFDEIRRIAKTLIRMEREEIDRPTEGFWPRYMALKKLLIGKIRKFGVIEYEQNRDI